MRYHLRDANDQDLDRVAALIMQANPDEPCTAEIVAEFDQSRPADSPFRRLVAVDDADRVLGYGEAIRFTWHAPGKFYVATTVDREYRRQGIGAALAAAVEGFAVEAGATLLEGSTRDADTDSRAWMERRGYALERHIFESVLDLGTFDEGPFAGVVAGCRQGGLRFFSLADEPGEETERKLYTLMCRTVKDIPGWDNPMDTPYATWHKWDLEGSLVRRDGIIIAADGERFVGATLLRAEPDGTMYTDHTSVDRAYRGRNVALALKLLSVAVARKYGAPSMRTNNDSLNAPMLAVNGKMGYRPLPGIYRLRRFSRNSSPC
jgi:GNAT superfamily N-acetyltransferase